VVSCRNRKPGPLGLPDDLSAEASAKAEALTKAGDRTLPVRLSALCALTSFLPWRKVRPEQSGHERRPAPPDSRYWEILTNSENLDFQDNL